MTVNAINGSLLSALSAVDGVALSTLNAINGQALAGGAPASGDLVFLGSADVEPTAGGAPRWWDGVSGGAPTTSTTPTGVHSRAWNNTGAGSVTVDLPSSTLTPAFVIRIYVTSDTTGLIIRLRGSATDDHFDLNYVAGGNFQVEHNLSTQLAISTGGHIALNTQYYLTFSGVVANSPGGSFVCKLYDDSSTLLETITNSGVDTQDGATGVASIVFGGYVGYYEDAYFDAEGQDYGPCQVEISPPDGPGDLAQLTRAGTDTGANWSQVDEIPVAGAGESVVQSTGADQYDCYSIADRSVAGTPIACGVSAGVLTTTGSVSFNFICRIAGVTYEHALSHTATTSVKMFGAYWRNNPATNAPWTDTEINAAQFGVHAHAANLSVRGLYRATLVQL